MQPRSPPRARAAAPRPPERRAASRDFQPDLLDHSQDSERRRAAGIEQPVGHRSCPLVVVPIRRGARVDGGVRRRALVSACESLFAKAEEEALRDRRLGAARGIVVERACQRVRRMSVEAVRVRTCGAEPARVDLIACFGYVVAVETDAGGPAQRAALQEPVGGARSQLVLVVEDHEWRVLAAISSIAITNPRSRCRSR